MIGRKPPHSGNSGFSYYDFVLFVLPIPLFVGLLAGKMLSVPSRAGLMTGAALSAFVVCHVLFFDPPTRRGPGGRGGRDGSQESPKSRGSSTGRSA